DGRWKLLAWDARLRHPGGNYIMNSSSPAEPIIEPELPIIDAHHHLWFRSPESLTFLEQDDSEYTRTALPVYRSHARYLLDEIMADINTGHNVRATVYIEAHAMLRTTGPEEMKSVGEVEFANGIAAMAAGGPWGDVAVCAGIVGGIDLKRFGDRSKEIMLAHKQ